MSDEMVEVIIKMTREEHEKLKNLAEWRSTNGGKKITPSACVRGFIRSSITGPSGWEHPFKAAQKAAQKKQNEQEEAGETEETSAQNS